MSVGHPILRKALTNAAEQMIRNRALEGLEYVDRTDVHAYGPFPSEEMLYAMLDGETMAATQAQKAALVAERDSSPLAFSHYLLVADFKDKAAPAPTAGVLVKGVA